MKKPILNVDIVKSKLLGMQGRNVKLKVNKGRKKIEIVSGVLKDLYPSVFTVETKNIEKVLGLLTYSYTEIVCGNVRICLEK